VNKNNLLVIFGGASSEHSISLVSSSSVIDNLNKNKYNVIKVGITKEGKWLLTNSTSENIKSGAWENEKDNIEAILSPSTNTKGLLKLKDNKFSIVPIDVIFPVLHGKNGEDGTIQGLFELANIPYVGPYVASSANCMDKTITKIILDKYNITQAKWILINFLDFKNDFEKETNNIENEFTYPVFVKPSSTGSSIGISKAQNKDELIISIEQASKYGNKILIEEFIDGAEIEVAVLGNEHPIASVCGEIAPSRDFYDYTAKYNDDNSLLFIPARIDEITSDSVREIALLVFKALDCKGLSRVDFFVNKVTNRIIFNEINTMPGFTSISMYPKLLEASGIPYSMLLDRLIELALERNN